MVVVSKCPAMQKTHAETESGNPLGYNRDKFILQG